MKNVKIVAFMLVCVVLFGMLAACGESDNPKLDKPIKVYVKVYDDPSVSDKPNKANYTDDDINYILSDEGDYLEITTEYANVMGTVKKALEDKGISCSADSDNATFSNIDSYSYLEPTETDSGNCWSFKINNVTGAKAGDTAVEEGDKIDFYYDYLEPTAGKIAD